MKYQPQLYASPIDLPEGRSGKIEVKHSTLEGKVYVVSDREAYTRGLRPAFAVLPKPRRIHELREDGRGVWMTDHPCELNQIAEMLATIRPRGRVLVGGLGLGLLARALTQRDAVKSVTVIELSSDVIKLCQAPGYEVVQDDLLKFLRCSERSFDCYLLDTWQGTNEGTWWSNVVPLRRAIRGRWGAKPVIWGWAEDVMRGQVERTIAMGNRSWKYAGLPEVMSPAAIRAFTRDVGLPAWERRYGREKETADA